MGEGSFTALGGTAGAKVEAGSLPLEGSERRGVGEPLAWASHTQAAWDQDAKAAPRLADLLRFWASTGEDSMRSRAVRSPPVDASAPAPLTKCYLGAEPSAILWLTAATSTFGGAIATLMITDLGRLASSKDVERWGDHGVDVSTPRDSRMALKARETMPKSSSRSPTLHVHPTPWGSTTDPRRSDGMPASITWPGSMLKSPKMP